LNILTLRNSTVYENGANWYFNGASFGFSKDLPVDLTTYADKHDCVLRNGSYSCSDKNRLSWITYSPLPGWRYDI
jgi:hypothetical protein